MDTFDNREGFFSLCIVTASAFLLLRTFTIIFSHCSANLFRKTNILIALVGGELFQLTWQSNTAHVYDPEKRTGLRDHRYAGEGWGLTTDGEKLYMTDGTANLYTIDPATFRRERRTTVTLRGEPVELLNELEWIDGRIWANVYTTDQIVIIDPATGRVEGIVDLRGLLPDEDRTPGTDVLNGIAYDAATGRIFLTGKNWSKLFEIELVRQ